MNRIERNSEMKSYRKEINPVPLTTANPVRSVLLWAKDAKRPKPLSYCMESYANRRLRGMCP